MNLENLQTNKRLGKVFFITILLISAIMYFWQLSAFPLVDYDEATYAQVTRDTMASGDILTLKRFDNPWFEKPPMYFWLAMASTSVFGENEFAFRFPGAILAILSVALVWLITKRLTKDNVTASIASVVLLFMSYYYFNAREIRLDIPVITSILAALYFWLRSKDKSSWLIYILPAVAIGILFKSVIALLALPIILLFSLVYHRWRWLKDKYFWWGAIIAAVIAIPWHWYQAALYGSAFWEKYLGFSVLDRFTSRVTGRSEFVFFDYIPLLWIHAQPWFQLFILLTVALIAYRLFAKQKIPRQLIALYSVVFFIFLLFSFSRTHILTYLLPMFPFLAIAIASATSYLLIRERRKNGLWFALGLIVITVGLAARVHAGIVPEVIEKIQYWYHIEERNVGQLVAEDPDAKFYLLDWGIHETLRYYSGKQIHNIPLPPEEGTILEAPWYLFVVNRKLTFFAAEDGSGNIKPEYAHIEIKYTGDNSMLFYGDEDLVLE